MRPGDLFNLFLLSIPFWIPAAIGLYLVADRRNELSLMAGLLTLKPILTAPLWALMISSLASYINRPSTQSSAVDSALLALWSILPGAGLTLLVLLIFRRLFFGSRSTWARVLILLDCVRWTNSGLLTAANAMAYYDSIAPFVCIFALIGLFFPTAYAVVALTTTMATHEYERAA
jgi:hypothetical protein